MSGYALVRPHLMAWVAGHPLENPPPRLELVAPRSGSDGDAASQAREELAWASDALAAVARSAPAAALASLRPLLGAPLRPSPFETLLEEAGAQLATAAGEDALAHAFLERRHAYAHRFGGGADLLGVEALLAHPAAQAALEPSTDDEPELSSALAAPFPAPSSSGFVPFAAAHEPDTPAYVVTLRHLQDAPTATFAVHRVAWHDLESDDPSLSDLVLAFEDDAGSMLRTIDPDALRLRLFFGDGPAYDEVTTADGTLFDVEVNPPEGRIYLKLRRPAAWAATELPAAELWRQLHSCVLITEPG